MKLIVGLGNPGQKYRFNRHNLGYLVVDEFAKVNGFSWRYSRDWICFFYKGSDVAIAKPSTYMNRSGDSVRSILNFYNIEARDLLVVHDELDLDFGKIRLSFDGSFAGHHGVESVISGIGTSEFARLRIGIGNPKKAGLKMDPASYVLSDFSEVEKKDLPNVVEKSVVAVKSFVDEGLGATMNRFN